MTIFPDMVNAVLSESILGRAIASGAIQAEVIDIRPFSLNKHKNTDDTPYGGGAGMVMLAQPAVDAIRYAMGEDFHGKRIYLSPKGTRFDQSTAERLAKEEELILFAGHYEGIDQRVIDSCIDEEISVGDYVLTGGELGALIVTDAVARLLPGVLGCDESSVDESFSSGLLEYPQYTRPRTFEGAEVPEVLLNGDQKRIDRWRRDEALKLTLLRRPELLKDTPLDGDDRQTLRREKQGLCLNIDVLSKDEVLVREVRARLYELSNGLVCFQGGENLLVLDADLPLPEEGKRVLLTRLPRPEEKQAAQARGTELFGFPSYAFDARFQELIGDGSIETLIISGMDRETWACLSTLWLKIRKCTPHTLYFAKNRRALHKAGAAPFIEAETRSGDHIRFAPGALPDRWLNAAINFFKTGTLPLSEAQIRAAQDAVSAIAQPRPFV